jgi:hypothetical protein
VSWCRRPTCTGTSASGLGADVTFRVAGEMFATHRCVLAARSLGACSRRCYINNCPAVLKDLWGVWFEDDPIQDGLALSL